MNGPQWRDRLVAELHRQGLPSAYVDRLVEELTDHTHDLFREDSRMDADMNLECRLGSPEQLASVAKVEFQRRTFAGRYPLFTFIIGPIIALPGTLLGTCALLWGLVYLADLLTGGWLIASAEKGLRPSVLEITIVHISNVVIRVVPFLWAVALFIRLGRRSGRQAWSLVACAIIAVTALFFQSTFYESDSIPVKGENHGIWTVGFRFEIASEQILQAALSLSLAAWMLRQLPGIRCKPRAIESQGV